MRKNDCIFCQIVAGEASSHTVWEDENHVAFLSIFPNTQGFTVVIPKNHENSYFADTSDETVTNLVLAAKKVAKRIDTAFPDVGRTGLIFEGFGVDHLHAKLVPLHGTVADEWRQHRSDERRFFETYPGYISSHDSERADDAALAALAERIRNATS